MHWHPPLSPYLMLVVIALALALMVLSFLIPRRQMSANGPVLLGTLGLRIAGFLLLLFFLLQPSKLPAAQEITVRRTLAVLIDTSGSMSKQDGPAESEPTRLKLGLKHLAGANLVQQVTADAKLSVYGFGGQTLPIRTDALLNLKANGKQTNIAAAVEQIARQHQADDLAGIVLISDGRNTEGADPIEVVERIKAPLYVLPVGRHWEPPAQAPVEQRKDLSIDAVTAPPRAILGRTVQVVATVSAAGYDARQIDVELLQEDQAISDSAVSISAEHTRRQAMFAVKPPSVGTHTYQVRVPTDEEDTDSTNNLKSFTIEVVDPVNRLLYLDWLRNERRFLRRVIDRLRHVRYTAIVQQNEQRLMVQGNDEQMKREAATLSPKQLRGLKAIIIGDLPAETLSPEQIDAVALWVDRGGAMLLLGGPQSLGAAGFATTPLARMLPVQVASGQNYVEQDIWVRLTPQGAAHPAFQRVGRNWTPPAPLLSLIRVQSVKPAATVLIEQRDAPNAPVLVSHSYGHGKVAVVLTDSTWRWQLAATRARRSEHAVFWQQIIDWLLPELKQTSEDSGLVQLITDRLTYDVNEPVTMIAGVRGADGQTMKEAEVEFRIAAPDGRPIRRTGRLEGEGAEGFTASFDVPIDGEYAIQVVATVDGQTVGTDEASITVTQPVIEFAQTDPDHELLRRLAEASKGKALRPQDLRDIVTLANLAPRKVQVQPNAEDDAEPVWNHWLLLIAFIMLMSGEWFIRRRNQWV